MRQTKDGKIFSGTDEVVSGQGRVEEPFHVLYSDMMKGNNDDDDFMM